MYSALDVSSWEVVHSELTEETGVARLQIRRRVRMNIDKNAPLTPLRREEMALSVIEGRFSQAKAASKYAVTAERYRAEAMPAWPTARRSATIRSTIGCSVALGAVLGPHGPWGTAKRPRA